MWRRIKWQTTNAWITEVLAVTLPTDLKGARSIVSFHTSIQGSLMARSLYHVCLLLFAWLRSVLCSSLLYCFVTVSISMHIMTSNKMFLASCLLGCPARLAHHKSPSCFRVYYIDWLRGNDSPVTLTPYIWNSVRIRISKSPIPNVNSAHPWTPAGNKQGRIGRKPTQMTIRYHTEEG